MNISHRISNILPGGSDGWEVFYRARAMIADGVEVTELTIGEHDIRTDPIILEAMTRSAASGHTGYAAVPGSAALRDAVADRFVQRTGVPTTRDNVVITPGGQSALFSAHFATCDPGDTALYCDPYYATYPGTIRATGAVDVSIPTRAEDAFQPSFEDISSRADGAKSLLINTPNNPTGVVYDDPTMDGIARASIAHDLWLISDEVYDTQVWDGTHISPRGLPGMAERTLVVGSMSKSHAMTGSRIGWIVGPEEMIAHIINLATHTTYGVPGYIQDAATFALAQGPALEEKVGAPFARRRIIAKDMIASQNLVRMVPSGGAMYLMLDLRGTGVPSMEFANGLLDKHKIAVMPGDSFGTSAAGHIRVAMTVDDAAFAAALGTILSYAQEISK